MIRSLFLSIAFWTLAVRKIYGLQCFTCVNSPTHEACAKEGSLRNCQENEKSCATEIRWVSTSLRQMITKRCKQKQACYNNRNYDVCKAKKPNSMCYCCCDSDLCNRGDQHCFGNIPNINKEKRPTGIAPTPLRDFVTSRCLPRMRAPRSGSVQCSEGNNVGSRCTFRCRNGFIMSESSNAVCQKNGRWSSVAPVCSAPRCYPYYSWLRNGFVWCSNSNRANTKCRFQCKNGYKMRGNPTATCEAGSDVRSRGKWSQSKPTCIKYYKNFVVASSVLPVTCPRISQIPDSTTKCTKSNRLGSRCTVQCKAGYKIQGKSTLSCYRGNGRYMWSANTPKCKKQTCSSIEGASSLMFECSFGFDIGSVCTFNCPEGFDLIGQYTITCKSSQSGTKWSDDQPTCQEIPKCREPPHLPTMMSECDSTTYSTGVTCQFSCHGGHKLIGSSSVTCVDNKDGKAEWNREFPKCQESCPSFHDDEKRTSHCTEGTILGSVCTFTCKESYDLIGSPKVTCVENTHGTKVWDNVEPQCTKSCGEIPVTYDVIVRCTEGNVVGSYCTFSCGEYQELVGAKEVECVETKDGGQKWSDPAPQCQSICPALLRFASGRINCTDERKLFSTCQFECNPGYVLIGSSKVKCLSSNLSAPNWSGGLPVCERGRCPEISPITRGQYTCTNDNLFGSKCQFSCTGNYQILPVRSKASECMETMKWSNPVPCCSEICPSSPLMDLVIALDSSSSVGKTGWNLMIKFVQDLVRLYDFHDNGTYVAVFRYNKFIDTRSIIPFNYVKKHGKQALLRRIETIPYDGSGTNTGKAISFALNRMFSSHGGDRRHTKNVLIVLTDGRSQDPISEPAANLRNNKVTTYVIGVDTGTGKIDKSQLNEMAGKPQNLFITKNGYKSLGSDFAKELALSVCSSSCQ